MKAVLYNLYFEIPYGIRIGGRGEGSLLEAYQIEPGIYIIPASSWKGVFRRISESLMQKYPGAKTHKSESKHEGEVDTKDATELFKRVIEGHDSPLEFVKKYGDLGKIIVSVIKEKRENQFAEEFKEIYLSWNCPAERLYGSQYFASLVNFSDSVFSSMSDYRPHVVINRRTRTQEEKHLFKEQIVYPGKVNLKVLLRYSSEDDIPFKVWMDTLKFVEKVGIFIGASKSRGIGYTKLIKSESTMAKIEGLDKEVKWEKLNF